MSGLCKDCRHWMRDGMLAQRGAGGRVLRAVCSNYRSLLYRGQMTPSSLGCLEFSQADLHTLLRHDANVSSLDSMALTDGTGGFGGPAEALQRSVCSLLMRQT